MEIEWFTVEAAQPHRLWLFLDFLGSKRLWLRRVFKTGKMTRMKSRRLALVISASLIAWLTGCGTPLQKPAGSIPAPALGGGLASLPELNATRTRSISAENLTGAKGKGGMAVPNHSSLSPGVQCEYLLLRFLWHELLSLRVNRRPAAAFPTHAGVPLLWRGAFCFRADEAPNLIDL